MPQAYTISPYFACVMRLKTLRDARKFRGKKRLCTFMLIERAFHIFTADYRLHGCQSRKRKTPPFPFKFRILPLMTRQKLITVTRILFFLAVVAWVCYLALKPASNTASQIYGFLLPVFVWLDGHDFIKNILGGITLQVAFLVGFRNTFYKFRHRFIVLWVFPMTLLFIGLELLQRGIPARTCDPNDMIAGALGVCMITLFAVNFHRGAGGGK